MNRLLHKYVLMYMKMLLDIFFCKMDRLLTFIFFISIHKQSNLVIAECCH